MSAAERQRMIDDMSDSDDETIMMMILSQKKKKKFVHSRNRHVYTRSLTIIKAILKKTHDVTSSFEQNAWRERNAHNAR